MTLWFVTPAWRRFALSAVCFEQRRRVIAELARHGIEARCVVVADDANIDIARAKGFDVLVRDNAWLGRRFNDGIEYAGLHGAQWIVPIGSDSWIDPAYFLPFPEPGPTRTSRLYTVVERTRLAELRVSDAKGAGPYLLHRSLFPASFRPAADRISHAVDQSTIRGLVSYPEWQRHELHRYQYVGFRGTPHLTSYARLVSAYGLRERKNPWVMLARYYPADLVRAAQRAL